MAKESKMSFSKEEYERRHTNIRALMQARGLDCLVITGHNGIFGAGGADIRYVAGVTTMMEGGPFVIFPFSGDPLLITHMIGGRNTGVLKAEQVAFKKGTRLRDYGGHVANRLRDLGFEKGTIGLVTTRVMPAKDYIVMSLELPQARFVPADDIVLHCRLVRSEEEIAFLRRSGEVADAGVRAIVESARPGVVEKELVFACDLAMARAGGERGNFILLGSGAWELEGAIFTGTDRKLEKGDIILTEITSNYEGYYTQLCCPIVLGKKPPAGFVKRLQINKTMYQTAFENLRPGNFVGSVEKMVEERVAGMGRWRRSWALQSAELAESFHKVNLQIQRNMCFVIHPWSEPLSGKGFMGHTIGNTCIVRDGEPEVLHKSSQDVITV
jgi:Xaa-Pro aminopeptidase